MMILARNKPEPNFPVSRVSAWLHSASGWMILATAATAPLAFGCVSPLSIAILNGSLFLALGVWAASLVLAHRRPCLPALALVCAGVLLAQGWFMVWNAKAVWLRGAGLTALHPLCPLLPGSIEQTVSLLTMIRVSALLAALAITADLARADVWRQRFMYALAISGTTVGVIGLAQATGWRTFFSQHMDPREGVYFATFNYHGNAGAYLNLTLPLLAVLWVSAIASPASVRRRAALSLMLIGMLAAAAAHTSRGAQAITVVLVSALAIWGVLILRRRSALFSGPPGRLFASVLGAGALLASIGLFSVFRSFDKWRMLPVHLSEVSARRQVWRVATPMARNAGPLGHGPGTFKILLPRSPRLGPAFWSVWIIQDHIPGSRVSMWSMAHQDYLQTWIEFGWLGSLAAGGIFFGGLFRGLRRSWQEMAAATEGQEILWPGVAAALAGVALHASFDFPLQVASLQLTTVILSGMCWSLPDRKMQPVCCNMRHPTGRKL